jgi:DNA replication and repair protein RecF
LFFHIQSGLNFYEIRKQKTNILEAISYLSYTKSFLQNSETDCVKYGENQFEIHGSFLNEIETEFKINLSYSSADAVKSYILNSEKVNRLNSILGLFPLVTLSPYDLKLTTGSPHERRRDFDLLISQTSRVYLNDLRNLSRILKQKNALLKKT